MIYAIGDIHGQLAELERALDLIARDGGQGRRVVFLGDYTDRGPDSRGVINHLMAGLAAGRDWVLLRGNHDRMFTRFVREGRADDLQIKSGLGWLAGPLGGAETLASYGVDPAGPFPVAAARRAVPAAHLDFLAARPVMHRQEGLVFVHAGIRPGVALPDQVEEDLIWIRAGFLHDTRDHGALVVHGHSAIDHPGHFGNRVNLDGGAGYGRPLVPVVFDQGRVWALGRSGRTELLPS